jgi:hypothetical protein
LNPFRPRLHQVELITERTMRLEAFLAGLALFLSLGAAQAEILDCPAKSTTFDDIIDAINAAGGCERAMKIFQGCEFSASGDVGLGAAVEKKCEADFLTGLKAPQKQAYQREMHVCDRKYRNREGTMSLSFTAFCRAEVSQRYSRKALKAKAGPR